MSEYDNIKRALDESSYENENLRRTIALKTEENLHLVHEAERSNENGS